jgi:uncharacterized protein (TIGR00288 family)
MPDRASQLAVFFDYDNQKVDPVAVLDHLKELGRIAIKRAYGDWVRDRAIRGAMSEQDVELIDRPRFGLSDRQGNDILLAADAVEVALTRPNIDTIVLVTGDSDFLPLISRLKAFGKTIFLVSSERNNPPRLRAACDRFISYEHVAKAEELIPDDARERAFALFRRVERIFRDRDEPLTGPRCQQAIIHLYPGFTPGAAGFADFAAFFAEATRPVRGEEPTAAIPDRDSEENRWQVLIFTVYGALDRLREDQVPPTPEAVDRQLRQMMPQLTLHSFGARQFPDLLRKLVRRGTLELTGGEVLLPRPAAWARYLRNAVLRPNPEIRPQFVREVLNLAGNWNPPETLTLKALASRLLDDGRIPGLSRKVMNELMRALKFSGCVLPHGEEGYVTFTMPCKIRGDAATLERGMDKAYIKGLLKARSAHIADLSAIADLVFGSKVETDQVRPLLDELIAEGEVKYEDGEYRFVGVAGPGGMAAARPAQEPD